MRNTAKPIRVIFLLFMFNIAKVLAQPYEIGNTSITLFDADRNRNIPTQIYYPAQQALVNADLAPGTFPVLIFGHGFLMSWESYQNFWEALVPEGYVLCFPTTESGAQPSHENFGLDLRFLANAMQDANADNTSVFFEGLQPKTALMGHSMGGGASFLAAANNGTIQALVNFAAAETNPSAISACSNINVPTLLFSGDDDCVTPPADHQDLMYDALASNCKTQINILNGGHCYFANTDFICSFGESSCNPTLNISREEQQDITFDFLKIWLHYTLQDDVNAFEVFNDSLTQSSRIDFRQFCTDAGLGMEEFNEEIKIYPNPAIGSVQVAFPKEFLGAHLEIYDNSGKRIFDKNLTEEAHDLTDLLPGIYIISIRHLNFIYSEKLVKLP